MQNDGVDSLHELARGESASGDDVEGIVLTESLVRLVDRALIRVDGDAGNPILNFRSRYPATSQSIVSIFFWLF